MARFEPLAMNAGVIGRKRIPRWARTMALAACCGHLPICVSALVQEQTKPTKPLLTLTTAHEAHSLAPKEAAQHRPVHLRAVVTYYDPYIDSRHGAIFVHDASGSVFVSVPLRPILPIRAGTLVDVIGVSGPGDYAPIVQEAQVRAIRQSQVPQRAPHASMAQLLSGEKDGQWVEVEGVVHAVHLKPRNVVLDLATTGGPLSATTLREEGRDYGQLIDSLISLRANEAPVFNGRSQMVGAHLYFPDLSVVKVIQAAPADPFASPAVAIPDLLRFNPNAQFRHRVHVQGTTTLHWPGQILCIQQAGRGLCMQAAQSTRVNVGDFVDLLGFPAVNDYQLTLENGTFRVARGGETPRSRKMTALQALTEDTNGELITIDGTLLGDDRASSNRTLFLRNGSTLLSVILPPGLFGTGILPWKDGSELSVTGICSAQVDAQDTMLQEGAVRTKSVRLLLRSPEDIVVLRAPSWWTPARTLLTLAIVGVIAAAAFFWIVLLRRRVGQQTEVIRRSEERLRHMAEHDALTKLPNRTLLNDRLQMALERVSRFKSTLAVLMVDLDRFKEVNDSLGHLAGDQLLCWVAERLMALVRKTDTVARIGGDEFVVLLEDLHSAEEAESIALKIVS